MEPNSLQINHPIPHELFEIPPSSADSIVDADIGVMYRVRGGGSYRRKGNIFVLGSAQETASTPDKNAPYNYDATNESNMLGNELAQGSHQGVVSSARESLFLSTAIMAIYRTGFCRSVDFWCCLAQVFVRKRREDRNHE